MFVVVLVVLIVVEDLDEGLPRGLVDVRRVLVADLLELLVVDFPGGLVDSGRSPWPLLRSCPHSTVALSLASPSRCELCLSLVLLCQLLVSSGETGFLCKVLSDPAGPYAD